jgi:hypothetical protein
MLGIAHSFGQVQLSTAHNISMTLTSAITTSPASAASSKILALIEDEEGKYQTSLNDAYHEMKEKTFKGLRRTLPLTRQKLDWDKVHTHSLSACRCKNYSLIFFFVVCSRFLGISWVQNCLPVAKAQWVIRRYMYFFWPQVTWSNKHVNVTLTRSCSLQLKYNVGRPILPPVPEAPQVSRGYFMNIA